MQPIQINVSVNIGVTPELNGLLLSLLNRPQAEAEATAPAPKRTRTAKPQPVEKQIPETKPEPEAAKEETPEPQPETPATTETAPAAPVQENKTCTVVDVRAAMDRTRRRIEGENWKENPDGEGYKTWHRALTGWFKNTAALCGAEKPSALPEGESCAKFVACCDAVYVKDGVLTEDCPF